MLKYIGPFLRMNNLTEDQIRSQLFYFAKESVNFTVLYSNLGIPTSAKKLNTKNVPTIDINISEKISPLVCVYKKASAKLKDKNNSLIWNEKKFKKEIDISSNVFMNLCIQELIDYYRTFQNIDTEKYKYSKFYTKLAKTQLDFFASYLRNDQGVFINKKDNTDPMTEKIKLKEKEEDYKFSNQALIMLAFYKCSTYLKEEEKDEYLNFSEDILNMFTNFKDEIYKIPEDDLLDTCLYISLFYNFTKSNKAKLLCLDLCDYYMGNYKKDVSIDKLDVISKMYIMNKLLYINSNIYSFNDYSKELFQKLLDNYDKNKALLIKSPMEEEFKISSKEIILSYIIMFNEKTGNEESDYDLIELYLNQIVKSGLITSWPQTPSLGDSERYRNFEEKSDKLLEDEYFKSSDLETPSESKLTPCFLRYLTYNNSKDKFDQSKELFDSKRNFNLFFAILFAYNNKFI
ncbi:hypothetical protein [Clostridium sp. DL1XJH146]